MVNICLVKNINKKFSSSKWIKRSSNIYNHEKPRLHYFSNYSENVWNYGKARLKISPKYEQKKNSSQSFQLQRGSPYPPFPSYTPVFVRDCLPYTPYKGLQLINYKTIDWNSNEVVLLYYWSMFLNQVQFLNFQSFYDPIFKQISQVPFFMILTNF